MKTLYLFNETEYDIPLKDLKVIIDSREFNQEDYDPATKTLYLSPMFLDNK